MIDTSNFKPITRTAPSIIKRHASFLRTPNVVIQSDKRLRFSAGATEHCQLKAGKYLTFYNPNGKIWYFTIGEDVSGFKLFADGRNGAGASIVAKAFVAEFIENVGCSVGDKYLVQKTNSEFNGKPLFEILTNKTVGKIGK